MPKNALPIILLIVVVFAALWFVDSPPEQFQPSPQQEEGKPVLVRYINNVETTQFNQLGQREHFFKATRVNHRRVLNDDSKQPGTAEIFKPNVTLFKNGVINWTIQSQFGESQLGDELIFLREKVLVEQLSPTKGWTITTSSLWIDPNTQEANTDAPVKLSTAGLLSTGTGMSASFIDENFKVLANTETIYETQ